MNLDQLVVRLNETVPGFVHYRESDGSLFDGESPHAVFAACSHYVRENVISREVWRSLASLLNEIVGSGDDIDNAACTCFLENLACDTHPLQELLQGQALEQWRKWSGL
ncbi:MAG: hypothetical protein RL885_21545 [Planctomycetota bacterium]